jgi:hypothetical protein
MPRRPASFRQDDVERLIKAAKAAGEQVSKVEIDKDGKIVVTIGKPDASGSTREIIL